MSSNRNIRDSWDHPEGVAVPPPGTRPALTRPTWLRLPRRTPAIFLIAIFVAMIGFVPMLETINASRYGHQPYQFDVFTRVPTPKNLKAYEESLAAFSVVTGYVRHWMRGFLFAALNDAGQQALVGRDGWLFYQPGVSLQTQRSTRKQTTARDALAGVKDFRDQLAARGIKLVVVVAPSKESIHPDRLRRGTELPTRITSPDTRELFDLCQAEGVEVVDLFEVYRMARTNLETHLYLKTDTHWSPAGVRLAAEAVAQQISSRGGVNYDVQPLPIERVGDITKMNGFQSRIGTESIVCEQVLRRDSGLPYADDPSSEVLVLGDSFLRIYERDDIRMCDPRREEAHSAGFIAHLARELGQPVASIVMDGGGATLVRQELARRPQLLEGKKVVVWEFSERDIRLACEGWPRIRIGAIGSER